MYFKPIQKFDIDCEKVYQDFLFVYNQVKYNWLKIRPYWRKISVTYSDMHDPNDPLLWRCDPAYTKPLNIPNECFNTKNIVPFFKGTYTESVVHIINDWFLKENQRVTLVKFSALMSGGCIDQHIDPGTTWRYHVPIKIAPGMVIICNDIRYPIEEIGTLYAMNTRVMHGAENFSDQNRILLSFDTIKI